jgi:hypothetical protein
VLCCASKKKNKKKIQKTAFCNEKEPWVFQENEKKTKFWLDRPFPSQFNRIFLLNL